MHPMNPSCDDPFLFRRIMLLASTERNFIPSQEEYLCFLDFTNTTIRRASEELVTRPCGNQILTCLP